MEQFGKYEFIARLGVGGMAEVFLARQTGPAGFKKQLVVKRILSSYADDEKFITMFLDEARLVARLHHPNIVQIFELGQEEGRYYIAMEHVKGKSLSQIVSQHGELDLQIPLNYAAKLVSEVCNGLDYAHSFTDEDGTPYNLVHRDVTPENVLVSFDGPVKVIDFGVAKARSNLFKTQAGAIKGKLSYMSPEQIRGKQLDRRSDLFSLGIVLFELCTGKRPFGGDIDLSAVSDILSQPPKRPEDYVCNFPPRLTEIIFKALEKDINKRYQSSGEMQQDLEDFIHSCGKYVSVSAIGDYVKRLFSSNPEDRNYLQSIISQSQEYMQSGLNAAVGPALTPSPPVANTPYPATRPGQPTPGMPAPSLPGVRATPPGGVQVEQTVSLDVTRPPSAGMNSGMGSGLGPATPPLGGRNMQSLNAAQFSGSPSPVPSMPIGGSGSMPPAPSSPAMPGPAPKKSGGALKWIILLVLLLGGGGAGGYVAYNYFKGQKTDPPKDKPDVTQTDAVNAADVTVAKLTNDVQMPTLADVTAPQLLDITVPVPGVDVRNVHVPSMPDIRVPTPDLMVAQVDLNQPGNLNDPNGSGGPGQLPDTSSPGIPDVGGPGQNLIPDVSVVPDIRIPNIGVDIKMPSTPDVSVPMPDVNTAPPTTGMARVVLNTTPPTMVYIKKKKQGKTPLSLELPPGKYDLRFKGGGIYYRQKAHLSAGETFTVNKVFRKGTLRWRLPYGATVTLNGRFLGRAPLRPTSVWEGNHRVELYHNRMGYKKMTVTVKPGKSRSVTMRSRYRNPNNGGGGGTNRYRRW